MVVWLGGVLLAARLAMFTSPAVFCKYIVIARAEFERVGWVVGDEAELLEHLLSSRVESVDVVAKSTGEQGAGRWQA